MRDLKKEAALAAVPLVHPGMKLGLGAGATIAHLVTALAADAALLSTLTLYTSSAATHQLLEKWGLTVADAGDTDHLHLYFDGCDQLDRQLNALKSGGGIHTDEKILAVMADTFVLLADSSKLVEQLDARYPLTIEVVPQARQKLEKWLLAHFPGANLQWRKEDAHFRLTQRNNLLGDLHFQQLPALSALQAIREQVGVVEHSLFYQVAKKAIVADTNGIEWLDRKDFVKP